jgi:hypothetical protein
MKKTIILLVLIIGFTACKNDKKTKTENNAVATKDKTAIQNDGLTRITGDFVFFDDGAVLQTKTQIYGVFVTDKMHELNEQVKKYKTNDTDMVPVTIRGLVTEKKDDIIQWQYKVEIVEIINVEKPDSNQDNVIKLGTK